MNNKKPDYDTFKEVADACQGNYSKIAQTFSVSRQTVYNWCAEDKAFKEVINDYKMRLYDDALTAARALCVGVPKIDASGKFVGWIERPDPNTVRYLLSTLGKNEGFTERRDITSNGESIFPKVISIALDEGLEEEETKIET